MLFTLISSSDFRHHFFLFWPGFHFVGLGGFVESINLSLFSLVIPRTLFRQAKRSVWYTCNSKYGRNDKKCRSWLNCSLSSDVQYRKMALGQFLNYTCVQNTQMSQPYGLCPYGCFLWPHPTDPPVAWLGIKKMLVYHAPTHPAISPLSKRHSEKNNGQRLS